MKTKTPRRRTSLAGSSVAMGKPAGYCDTTRNDMLRRATEKPFSAAREYQAAFLAGGIVMR